MSAAAVRVGKSSTAPFCPGARHDAAPRLLSRFMLPLRASARVGLCKWNQYINALSDETGCDPGSIIKMANFIAFHACGIPTWELDAVTRPHINIGLPFECRANFNPLLDTVDAQTGQVRRDPQFENVKLASNGTALESFWVHHNTNIFEYQSVQPHGAPARPKQE